MIYTPNTLSLSPRAMALANAMTGDADDVSAHYYNPAGLALPRGHSMEVAYIYSKPFLEGGREDGPTIRERQSNRIVVLSTRVDLARLAGSWRCPPLGMGLSVNVDNDFRTMMVFDDMRASNGTFDRWGMANMTMQGALGVGVLPWLALGAGFQGGFLGSGIVETEADLTGGSSNEGTRMRGSFAPAPIGGVYVFGANWGAGAVFREETWGSFESIDVSATPAIAGQEFPEMELPLDFLDTYVPREIALGARVDRGAVSILADLSWKQWSRYEVVAAESHFVGSHSMFDTVDVWTPRAGVEWGLWENADLRAGYSFDQTPFRTIGTRFPGGGGGDTRGKVILDADTHVLALGAGRRFDAGGFLSIPWSVSAAYQAHVLAARDARTSDGHVYRSDGAVHVVMIGVKLGGGNGESAP